MDARFSKLPRFLEERARRVRFEGAADAGDEGLFGGVQGQIPVLLAHPDPGALDADGGVIGGDATPPLMIWMHGRTAHKELDPGRYLRWLRAGIGVCAIDMPGHGERRDDALQGADRSLQIVQHVARHEIDLLLATLRERGYGEVFDLERVGIGGMSLGGITTLVRLCREHGFACATVEACAGDFRAMRDRHGFRSADGDGLSELAQRLEPRTHLEAWRPIPLLALHSEKDAWIPVDGVRGFIEALRERHSKQGADAEMVRLQTWPETGAEFEHIGFGKVSNEAKNLQTEFLGEWLG